jgi:diguanylate cyclase (GGDEF)-like protein
MVKKNEHAFPTLDTAEAEQIIFELGKALDADGKWRQEFRSTLVCRTKPHADDLKPDSHTKTDFGNWYAAQAEGNLCKHPGFAAVGKNSEQMHNKARKLAQMICDDDAIKPAQYKAYDKSALRFRLSLRKMLSEAWDYLRYTDPLTGVMTRSAMAARIEAEQDRGKRSGQTCCIGMMDLDYFKAVNDTHGHQAGDKVLETVANHVNEHLRRYDQVFRYGGEEFLVLLPNTTTSNAKMVLDRMRNSIKRKAIKIDKKKSIHVTASFGVAELLTESPPESSIEMADQALYQAKEGGRNKVVIWESE